MHTPTLSRALILLMATATGLAVASNYYAQPLLHSIAQQFGLFGADAVLDHVDIAAVTVDDLATVAARRTKADFRGFYNAHFEAVFQQGDGCR